MFTAWICQNEVSVRWKRQANAVVVVVVTAATDAFLCWAFWCSAMTNFNIIITNNKYRINNNPLTCNLCCEVVLVLLFIRCWLFYAHLNDGFLCAQIHTIRIGTLNANSDQSNRVWNENSVRMERVKTRSCDSVWALLNEHAKRWEIYIFWWWRWFCYQLCIVLN